MGLAPLDPPYKSARSRRGGFTLVEMLIVVSIILLLAGLALGGMSSARESARVATTKATIAKLNEIVMEKYYSYLTRRPQMEISGGTLNRKQTKRARLDALRDLMRMEMPERWNDLTDGDSTSPTGDDPYPFSFGGVTVKVRTPGSSYALGQARYQRALSALQAAPKNMNATDASALIGKYSHAECLYMVVASDPENLAKFNAREIADTDGDGLPEFVDAWGTPIYWLRWAPGYSSALGGRSEIQSGDPNKDHDPFDTQHIDQAAFRLVPLILSAGPDKCFGIQFGQDVQFAGSPYIGPYMGVTEPVGVPVQVDEYDDPNAASGKAYRDFDNITNHYLEVR